MGQFKSMVKMMTTEPSVELKLKKGGHVAKKAYGGAMPMASTMPAAMAARMPARGGALPGASPMAPSMMARRKAMAAPLLMSKKGGKADDKAQDKAMIKKAFKQHDMQEHKGAKGTKLKLKNGGMYSEGGKIDAAETKTTIKGNAGKFVNTKVVDGDKTDRAHGTGAVKMGKPAGFKNGGAIEGNAKKFLNKVVDGDKKDTAHGTGGVKMGNGGGFKSGGSTNWENRPADTAKPGVSNTKTGEVKEANAGGYKKGGAAKKHFATGGSVNDTGRAVAMPRKPVSASIKNTMQSGTFKKGGKVMHKADGGRMPLKGHAYHDKSDDELKYILKDASEAARAMKNHSPKAESKYLDQVNDAATVMHYRKNSIPKKADGGSMDDQQMPLRDMSGGAYGRSIGPDQSDMDIANSIRNAPGTAMSAMMRLLGKRPATGAGAGRGMVNPPMARKKGGSAKC
jgi:hypothetical protein